MSEYLALTKALYDFGYKLDELSKNLESLSQELKRCNDTQEREDDGKWKSNRTR